MLFIAASLDPIVTPGQDMILVKDPVGLAPGYLSGWLRSRPQVLAWIYRTTGAMLIGLGVLLTFERKL